jgi:hypothetical protein
MRLPTPIPADWRGETLPIHLRAYSRPALLGPPAPAKPNGAARPKSGPSDLVRIFDTETTVDPPQRLRVLFYQLRIAGRLDEEAAAYDPEVLTPAELRTLRAYCADRSLPPPMTIEAFREEVFMSRGYGCGAQIVGFNLPFDLARIAIGAGPARVTKGRNKMRGGFTLKVSKHHWRPNVRVRQLNPRCALFEFAAEYRQRTSRSDRKRRSYVPVHRGHFTDVRTLAAALTSRPHSLASLTRSLGVMTQKVASEEHGGPLTTAYLDYARADVQATWECFEVLTKRFATYGLGDAHWDILSEASIGKATLSAMGIQPWLSLNPDPSPQLLSRILCSYFGGRTEVRWRKTIREVFHTDFTSMYPTVCTLQGLWRFISATGFDTRDATDEARGILASVTAEDLQDPAFWPRLVMLVKVRPDDDLAPVRAGYCSEKNATIGLNYLTADEGIWLTLADCLAAKILSGKAPVVEEAIGFAPGPVQPRLRPIRLLGRHQVDPRKDDLFRRVIQLRIAEKARAKSLAGAEKAAADELVRSLKIIANSSSYGIFIQTNVDTEPKPAAVEVFAVDGSSFETRSRKVERPGPFFHPLLATMITGAARLMLALAEHRAEAEGLDWVFCDTDSLALARPEGMSAEAFDAAAHRVIEWFTPLNPYGGAESILKPEAANFGMDDVTRRRPLYCLAVSSKRYALFNLDPDGRPVIRKGSAHGLGHLLAPYGDDDPAPGTPAVMAADTDLPRWQHDLWYVIIEAALRGRVNDVRYDFHPKLNLPALSRYGATSPELWRWFSPWNAGRAYPEQVKPFGFLYSLHAARDAKGKRRGDIRPIAPFDSTPGAAVRKAFDRMTGAAVAKKDLQTYAEALEGYHLSPESKFRNGEPFNIGRTERRHIRATGVEMIGKEADRYEEAYLLGLGEDLVIRHGASPALTADIIQEVGQAAKAYGASAVSRATGLTRASVAKARMGRPVSTRRSIAKIRTRLAALKAATVGAAAEQTAEVERLRAAVREHGGVRPAARALALDPSNLLKMIARRHISRPA